MSTEQSGARTRQVAAIIDGFGVAIREQYNRVLRVFRGLRLPTEWPIFPQGSPNAVAVKQTG